MKFLKRKMFLVFILLGALTGFFVWNYFIESEHILSMKLPDSPGIDFSQEAPQALTHSQVEDMIAGSNSATFLYLYTTWCKACKTYLPVINKIAKDFQGTDLNFIALAIDDDMDKEKMKRYLSKLGKVYFQQRYLAFNKKEFKKILKERGIAYEGAIPFSSIIMPDGKVIISKSGVKRDKYLRIKIIESLYNF